MENQHCYRSVYLKPQDVPSLRFAVEREDYNGIRTPLLKNVVILVVTSRPDDIPANISGKKNYICIYT